MLAVGLSVVRILLRILSRILNVCGFKRSKSGQFWWKFYIEIRKADQKLRRSIGGRALEELESLLVKALAALKSLD